jgi:SAM-dependent methyltransferase
MSRQDITARMKAHHAEVFALHGATPRGVDWNENQADVALRYDNMLSVIRREGGSGRPRLLDVGCGYGGLLDRILERRLDIDYTGIDICEDMLVEARKRHAGTTFEMRDIFDSTPPGAYDYLVCNGILTQKLDVPVDEMEEFSRALIRRMYDECVKGVAFNMMSDRVNFMADNLFYKNPAELLSWCMAEITPNVRLDHAYPLYEFTMYLYREGVPR